MARILLNLTTEDYGDYYNYNFNEDSAMPCNNGSVQVYGQVFLPTLYSIVFIVGFIGNVLLVGVFIRNFQKWNMTDMCLFNVVLSDLLFIISLPFWSHYAAISKWMMGDFMCRAVTSLYMLGFYGSIFFMMLMTLDRYFHIVHSQISLVSKSRSVKVGIALSILMWALSLGASLPTIIFSQVKNKSTGLSCKPEYPENTGWRQFSYIELNILGLILPLSVMMYCYSRIIRTLVTMIQSIRLILVLIIVFFILWTPYHVVIFLYYLQHLGHLASCEWQSGLGIAMQWVETIAFSHCCINPIIYVLVGHSFVTLRKL